MANAPRTDMTAMRDAVANGSVTAESICATMMAGARTHNPQLNAYHEVFEEQALGAHHVLDGDGGEQRAVRPAGATGAGLAWSAATIPLRVSA